MEIVYGCCCCGIDVHKNKLAVCVLRSGGGAKKVRKESWECGTTTRELLELSDKLHALGCESVAMESTGPYWKPPYNIFEDTGMPAIIVNAAHMKNVPGRKTDQTDAEWIADLHRHGLLKASFIPDREHRDLRDVLTQRRKMVEARSAEVNRIQKIFEGANIKLGSFISDVMGKSGLRLIEEMITAEVLTEESIQKLKDTKEIAGNLRAKPEELAEACRGSLSAAQRQQISCSLRHITVLEGIIADLEQVIDNLLTPHEHDGTKVLQTMPGVDETTAKTIVGIIGTDMTRFPTPDHLCSWAGVAPGNNESAGKRKKCRTRKGNKALKSALVVAANSAVKCKGTFFHARFNSLVKRLGRAKAIMAIAHSMLKAIWHMLLTGECFEDLGADYYNKQNTEGKIKRMLQKLKELGWSPESAEAAVN